MKIFTFKKTSLGWLLWIGDLCQIGYDKNSKKEYGYHNNLKEYGIYEEGTFIKVFCFGRFWICWKLYKKNS